METIWAMNPLARFVHVDPIIHVAAHPDRPEDRPLAEAYRLSQFQAWDMLGGRLWPELGGQEKYLDIIGVNYYSTTNGTTTSRDSAARMNSSR